MRTYSQAEFMMKFNVQKLMEIPFEENDAVKLGVVFDLDKGAVQTLLQEFRDNNRNAAKALSSVLSISQPDSNIRKTVVFAGDSNTANRECYFYILQALFTDHQGLNMINSGMSGWRSNNFFDTFYTYVLQFKPDIVSFMLGTNDMRKALDEQRLNNISLEEYENKMRYMIAKLIRMNVKVIINTVPPVHCSLFEKTHPDMNWTYSEADYQAYNGVLIRIGEETGALTNNMIPVYEKMNLDDLLLPDGIHLSPAGHSMLAAKLAPILIRALNS